MSVWSEFINETNTDVKLVVKRGGDVQCRRVFDSIVAGTDIDLKSSAPPNKHQISSESKAVKFSPTTVTIVPPSDGPEEG